VAPFAEADRVLGRHRHHGGVAPQTTRRRRQRLRTQARERTEIEPDGEVDRHARFPTSGTPGEAAGILEHRVAPQAFEPDDSSGRKHDAG
jgi:hypothetical protein